MELDAIKSVRDLRFELEYDIEYENDVSILVFTLHIITYLPSFAKTSMNSDGSGNVTGLKFEKNRARAQSCARSPI